MRNPILFLAILALASTSLAESSELDHAIGSYLADPDCVAAPLLAAEGKDAKWTFEVALYLWAAGVKGEIGARGTTVPVDVGFDKLFDQLDGAFMIHGTARKDRWGILVDFAWIGLKAESTGPLGQLTGTVNSDIFFAELAALYEVLETPIAESTQFLVDLYAGARFYAADNELVLPLRTVDQSDSWIDPIIGFDAFCRGDRWRAGLRADIGGFGVGSDLAWSVTLGADYSFSKLFSMALGYRWLDIDRTSGSGADEFKLDVQLSGPFLAFLFRF